MIKTLLAIWEREMYEYMNNLHVNALRLAVEPMLFIFIFGMGLGNRVDMGNVSYIDFLAPGILFMVVTNNSYMTISMRLMIARDWDKTLVNALTAPVKPFEIVLGYILAGITQALAASAIFIFFNELYFGNFFWLYTFFSVIHYSNCSIFFISRSCNSYVAGQSTSSDGCNISCCHANELFLRNIYTGY